MKSSSIKTEYSPEQVVSLPALAGEIAHGSLSQLTEGHFSQAFSFETNRGEMRVLRIGRKLRSFRADQYAHEHFASPTLPIPEVFEIGEVEPGLYYCTSEFAAGTPSDQLSQPEFNAAREAMEDLFAELFKTDVSSTTGFGRIDQSTDNGTESSQSIYAFDSEQIPYLKENCVKYGIDPKLVDKFYEQLLKNQDKVRFERRLTHGDLGSDNVIVNGEKIAVIDWSGVGYGDWLHDYSRIDFWYPGRQTPARDFAQKYGLETESFDERWLAHFAEHALTTIGYVLKYDDNGTAHWLKENLEDRLGYIDEKRTSQKGS
jgi:aminoglycoside phosphotransferase (APT) family kinase protein